MVDVKEAGIAKDQVVGATLALSCANPTVSREGIFLLSYCGIMVIAKIA